MTVQKYTMQVDFEVKNFQLPSEDEIDDGFFRFEGLASTFGNTDLVNDVIEPGAFRQSLKERIPTLLFAHSSFEPIGMPEEIAKPKKGYLYAAGYPRKIHWSVEE